MAQNWDRTEEKKKNIFKLRTYTVHYGTEECQEKIYSELITLQNKLILEK